MDAEEADHPVTESTGDLLRRYDAERQALYRAMRDEPEPDGSEGLSEWEAGYIVDQTALELEARLKGHGCAIYHDGYVYRYQGRSIGGGSHNIEEFKALTPDEADGEDEDNEPDTHGKHATTGQLPRFAERLLTPEEVRAARFRSTVRIQAMCPHVNREPRHFGEWCVDCGKEFFGA